MRQSLGYGVHSCIQFTKGKQEIECVTGQALQHNVVQIIAAGLTRCAAVASRTSSTPISRTRFWSCSM